MRLLLSPIMFLFVALTLASPALADDWTASKLRGLVLVNDLHGTGQWKKLSRGDVVSDDSPIRTMASGNVEFTRDAETIALGPNTDAQIFDRTGKRYTTVVEQFGQVDIDAQVQNVQHFAVETPYLVAVVKGTHFTVFSSATGSRVVVSRGLVGVTGHGQKHGALVAAGQQLTQTAAGETTITGTANQAATHPIVNGVEEDAVATTTSGVLGVVGGTADNVVGGVTGTVGGVVGGVGGTVGGVVGGVTGTVGGVVGGTVGNTVTTVGSAVGTTVTTTTTTVGSVVSSTGGTVSHVLHGLGL